MHNYKELKVWQKSIDLVELVYELTREFPSEEKYGLTSQSRRSSISISSNIAEGAGRNSQKEFSIFLGYAYGSACELETQLIIAQRLMYGKEEKYSNLTDMLDEIQKMIFTLKRQIQTELSQY